jgi:hypothetical protein
VEVLMGRGRGVGSPTDYVTDKGRRVYETPNREKVSEKSITIKIDDKYLNFPSIYKGIRYDETDVREMYEDGKISPTSTHDSLKDASKAAKDRSSKMKYIKKPYAYGGRVARMSVEKS